MSDMKEQNTDAGSAIGITTRLKVNAQDYSAFIHLLTNLTIESAKFSGMVNAEISPPTPGQENSWTIVQRFRTTAQACAWRDSAVRRETLEKLAPHLADGGATDEISQHDCGGAVAASIVSEIRPGMEEVYCDWLSNIQTAQAQFPGYQGTYLQMPTSGRPGQWTTLLRFDSPESLDRWFNSKQRHDLLDQSKRMVAAEMIQRMKSSFPGWMPLDEKGASPANWKAAMLVLLGLYPMVILEIRFLNPSLKGLQPSLAIFIANAISVSLVAFVTMPFLTQSFKSWLLPRSDADRKKIDMLGIAAVTGLYLLENLLFWYFI